MKDAKMPSSASSSTSPVIDGYSLRKDEFRGRILDAAEAMIVELGDVSFSTRDLAKRADVSFATPFNHFGSKLGVLDALIERSLINMPSVNTSNSGDAIAEMLLAANMVIEYYSSRSNLYRPVFSAVLARSSQPSNFPNSAILEAISIWRRSLSDAKSAGLIAKDRDIDVIADLIEYNWIGSVFSWIHNSLSCDQWRDLVTYNIALTMCGVVTDERRNEIQKMVTNLERRVGRIP